MRDRLAEGAQDEAPTGLFSLAAAKRDLGLKAGEGAPNADDSEAGVGVAPAGGGAAPAEAGAEPAEGGMDVEE